MRSLLAKKANALQNDMLRSSEDLRDVSRRLSRWRARYGGRGRRIPRELWLEAAAIASVAGVEVTARTLRLDPGRLEVVVSESVDSSGAAGEPGFVELDVQSLLAGDGGRCVVEVHHRAGHRLRIEVEGGLDVGALTRAFIGGES